MCATHTVEYMRATHTVAYMCATHTVAYMCATHTVAYKSAHLESLVARNVARGLAELAARHHRRKPEHIYICKALSY